MCSSEEEREREMRRRKEEEEALEVKSLRRIISAFLNYPEAAEEDVRRYERSFKRLPPAHKALLSTLPTKYKRLRRCISKNSFFIFSMLQAFEPPFDMRQDIDFWEAQNQENIPDGDLSCKINDCSHKSELPSGRLKMQKAEETSRGGAGNSSSKCPGGLTVNQADKLVESNESDCGGCFSSSQDNKNPLKAGDNELKPVHHQSPERSPSHSNGNVLSPPDWLDPSFQSHVPIVDVDKVRCIIRNIVRDWAAEGKMEREQCYKPILEELEIQFPSRQKESPPACLVPGAGLGRLALEISTLGFISQGNEFSYYMMICSNFILNLAETADEWTIYPWIHSNCNSLSDSDQLRPISVPDIHPASAGITEGFSMCGGDFIEVYSDPTQVGAWDAVVTCFFIDTAHNIVEYIEVISRILRDGGVWINLGPLLYHFSEVYGQDDDMSIELSLEDVKRVALRCGFELEKEKTIETTYTTNCRSMMQNQYKAAFWTMRKKFSIDNKILHRFLDDEIDNRSSK